MAGEISHVSLPYEEASLSLETGGMFIAVFLPRHAGSKIPMVIALGNVIRMCMSDDASFWVPHRQNAAPKERKFCSKMLG
jgi:hypothetical protein